MDETTKQDKIFKMIKNSYFGVGIIIVFLLLNNLSIFLNNLSEIPESIDKLVDRVFDPERLFSKEDSSYCILIIPFNSGKINPDSDLGKEIERRYLQKNLLNKNILVKYWHYELKETSIVTNEIARSWKKYHNANMVIYGSLNFNKSKFSLQYISDAINDLDFYELDNVAEQNSYDELIDISLFDSNTSFKYVDFVIDYSFVKADISEEKYESAIDKLLKMRPRYYIGGRTFSNKINLTYRDSMQFSTIEFALGSLYCLENNIDKGIKYLKNCITFPSYNRRADYDIGVFFMTKNKPDSALLYFNKYLGHKDTLAFSANALHNMGVIYQDQNKDTIAEEKYNLALEYDPNKANTHNNLGNLYLKRNDYSNSKKAYLNAIDKNPSYSKAYYNLGVVETRCKNHKEARYYYSKVIEIDSLDTKTYRAIMRSYKRQSMYKEANDYRIKAIKSQYYKAEKLFEEEKYKDALAVFEIVEEVKPNFLNTADYIKEIKIAMRSKLKKKHTTSAHKYNKI